MTLITRVLQSVSEKGNPSLACMPLYVNYSVYEDNFFHNRKDQAFGCRTTCFSSIIYSREQLSKYEPDKNCLSKVHIFPVENWV